MQPPGGDDGSLTIKVCDQARMEQKLTSWFFFSFKVVLPERNLRTALRLQGSQKLADVVSLLCSKFSLAPAEDYALFHSSNGAATRLDAVRAISSYGLANLVEFSTVVAFILFFCS